MKIRFIRNDMKPNLHLVAVDPELMVERNGRWYWRMDVDFEQTPRAAWLHVKNADAVPADDEAREFCKDAMTNWQQKLIRREALAKGIAPEDMERFERGELAGYDDDGNDIPGPNYKERDEEEDDD